MGRERDEESGQYTDAYADEDFLDAIEQADGMAGTGEVAEIVGCSDRQALNRLKQLEAEGEIKGKNIGRSFVWRIV